MAFSLGPRRTAVASSSAIATSLRAPHGCRTTTQRAYTTGHYPMHLSELTLIPYHTPSQAQGTVIDQTISPLPRSARQLRRLSTTVSPDNQLPPSPWTDEAIQPHLNELGQRIRARSTGQGLSGSQSPLASLQAAFPAERQRHQVRQWLQTYHLTEQYFLGICKAFELQSWTACQSLIQGQSIATPDWPVPILLHALEHVYTLTEASAALKQVVYQLRYIDAKDATVASTLLMDALCVQTAALHLFSLFNDLLTEVAGLLFSHHADTSEGLSVWQEEYMELLQDYVTHLTKWADRRTRRAALQIVDLVDRLAQAKVVPDEASSHFRDLLCGISGRELEPSMPRTVYLQRERPTFEEYDWLFLEDRMWGLLAKGRETKAEAEQLLFASMFATFAARNNDSDLFQELSSLINNLQSHLPKSHATWQAARIQYIRAVLSHPGTTTAEAIPFAYRLLQEALPGASAVSEKRLWRVFFRFGMERSDVETHFFLRILSVAGGKNISGAPSQTSLEQVPSDACMADGTLYKSLFSGLSRRQKQSPNDFQVGLRIWRHMLARGISPSPKIAITMARLSILCRYWADTLAILRYLSIGPTSDKAVRSLREELLNARIKLKSFSTKFSTLTESEGTDRIAQTDSQDLKWCSRMLLASSVSAEQYAASYPIWKYAPRILGASFDAYSLANLLRTALSISHLALGKSAYASSREAHVSNQMSRLRWDHRLPTSQAGRIFRQLFVTQHPDMEHENSAFEAMSKGQSWLTRSELQMQKWESWLSDAWKRFTRQSDRELRLETAVPSPARCPSDSPTQKRDSWHTIVFNAQLFDLYLIVSIHSRLLEGEDVSHSLQEHLKVLSWMRRLEIEPTKDSLCYISHIIWEALPPMLFMEKTEDAEEAGPPMGPLQDWCDEWISPDVMPTMREARSRYRKQFKAVMASKWFG